MAKKPASPKTTEWPGAFEAFSNVMRQLHKNYSPLLFFVGSYSLITIVSLALQGKNSPLETGYKSYSDAVLILFAVPLTVYSLAVARRKPLTVTEFMTIDVKKLLFLVAAGILAVLMVAGSLLLLIIPAIWTIAWFALVSYVVVDKNLTPIEALKHSKKLATDHKGKVWGIIGVSILVSMVAGIIGSIPYVGVVAVAYASVLSGAAAAELYVWLSKQK